MAGGGQVEPEGGVLGLEHQLSLTSQLESRLRYGRGNAIGTISPQSSRSRSRVGSNDLAV